MSKTKKTIIETLIMLIAVGLMFGGYLWFKDHLSHRYDNIQEEEYQKYSTFEGDNTETFTATENDLLDPHGWTFSCCKDVMENANSSYLLFDRSGSIGVSRKRFAIELENNNHNDKNDNPFVNGYGLKDIECWLRDTIVDVTGRPSPNRILPVDKKSIISAFKKTLDLKTINQHYDEILNIGPDGGPSCVKYSGLKLRIENPRIQKMATRGADQIYAEIDALVTTKIKPNTARDEWIPKEGEAKEVTFYVVAEVLGHKIAVYDIAVKGYN